MYSRHLRWVRLILTCSCLVEVFSHWHLLLLHLGVFRCVAHWRLVDKTSEWINLVFQCDLWFYFGFVVLLCRRCIRVALSIVCLSVCPMPALKSKWKVVESSYLVHLDEYMYHFRKLRYKECHNWWIDDCTIFTLVTVRNDCNSLLLHVTNRLTLSGSVLTVCCCCCCCCCSILPMVGSIFTDTILICLVPTSLVDHNWYCLPPSSITNPRTLFLIDLPQLFSLIFVLQTLSLVMNHVWEYDLAISSVDF